MPNDPMTDFLFDDDLSAADPIMDQLIAWEEERQARSIILIPSESICAWPVRRVLDSCFTNLYAEGYPPSANTKLPLEELTDYPYRLAHYRRYADRRFYKGNAYVNLIESICRRRAAEAFATEKNPADKIFANVQPLSGAAANIAAFEAFVKLGDTVMGMDLMEGGHLSHGSQFHMSGKRYKIVSYGVDPKTELLDYDRILELAKQHKPKMIIAGYTSYPWAPDFAKFRAICDEVGAFLMADIAHPAGMAIAGAYPNPIDYADVVTFTTHKTLMGPRAAVILTTNGKYATKINNAVFPGEQGGPHMNTIAALSVAFHLARTESFKALQHKIVANAKLLADEFKRLGLRLSYGGTDTHLLLIDLKGLKGKNGELLYGEPAATILETAGIVLNKNTIPGDAMTPLASGLRLGTPWFTQRGAGEAEIKELARLIHKTLTNIEPFHYQYSARIQPRGKIDLRVMREISEETAALAARLRVEPATTHGYPHYPYLDAPLASTMLKLTGDKAEAFLQHVVAADLTKLGDQPLAALVLDQDGTVIDEIAVARLPKAENPRRDGFMLRANQENLAQLLPWLRGLSEGWLHFDADITAKLDGPVVLSQVPEDCKAAALLNDAPSLDASLAGRSAAKLLERIAMDKVYFIGQSALAAKAPVSDKVEFAWEEKETPLMRTTLYDEHVKLGGRIVPFAGYEMPVRYGSTMEEHAAVRKAAGLFDVSHMGCFEAGGPHAVELINLATSNDARQYEPGKSFYCYLLDHDGRVIDDLIVYRLGEERFLMVVNAANEAKDWTWLNLVNDGKALLDRAVPSRSLTAPATLRNLKDEQWGDDRRVDLALQGPKSIEILARLADKGQAPIIKRLKRTECTETKLIGLDVVVSRTGYTGESFGYEIFVHPDKAPELWRAILEKGADLGVQAIGLGARDSLRIEAALPLYGHELEGMYGISPAGAGFASFVKLHKPFFVGKAKYLDSFHGGDRIVMAFKVPAKGTKPVKPGDPVIDKRGAFIGNVTSAAVDADGLQVGLAYLFKKNAQPGPVSIYPLPPSKDKGMTTPLDLKPGVRLTVPVEAEIL
ncbi:MAG TPA: glycine cleavage system aminomethyltransferase GcvT [bacterium]|nr:glycine cleavage system aminomethyltransferase GcvT [bacterium]